MVEVGTGGKGTRFIDTNWPNEEGLTAGTQTQIGRVSNLIPEGINGVKTTVLDRDRKLL